MHDRIAELAGLRNELATCLNSPDPERRAVVGQIREHIARLRNTLETEAEALEVRAEAIASAGQEVPAAQVAVGARALRQALAEDEAREDTTPEPVAPDPDSPGAGGDFDPKGRKVDEIRAHLAEADEAEVERVLALEAAGQKRKGLLEQREQLLDAARSRAASTAGPDGPKTNTAAAAAPETRTGDA